MNSSVGLAIPCATAPRLWVRRAWGRLSPGSLMWFAVCVVAWYAASEAFFALSPEKPPNFSRAALAFSVIGVLSIAPMVMVADEAVEAGKPAWICYAVALVVGVALTVAMTEAAKSSLNLQFDDPLLNASPWWLKVQSATGWFFGFMSGAICGVLVYLNLRRARFADERRREAELARAHARRRTLESQLQAMQARVEPQFLFNTLGQVKELYDQNPSLAQGILGNLIAYLRAAMPRMRDTTSTVAQEIDLARAYLDIVALRLSDHLKVDIEVPAVASDWRMPPMLLLPLIDHAIAHGVGAARPDRSLRIACESAGKKLRLVIADSGAGFAPETRGVGITGIRERLAALYSDGARLELCRGAGQSTYAMMEIPFEDARHFATADTTQS